MEDHMSYLCLLRNSCLKDILLPTATCSNETLTWTVIMIICGEQYRLIIATMFAFLVINSMQSPSQSLKFKECSLYPVINVHHLICQVSWPVSFFSIIWNNIYFVFSRSQKISTCDIYEDLSNSAIPATWYHIIPDNNDIIPNTI